MAREADPEDSCMACKKFGLYSAGNGESLVSYKLGHMTKLVFLERQYLVVV